MGKNGRRLIASGCAWEKKKLPASVLGLAKELGLEVVGDTEVLIRSGLGAGLILSKWMYMESGSIMVDLVLRQVISL